MSHLRTDPIAFARRQVAALRETLAPLLRERYSVTSPEHVDDVVADLMRREPGLAGNVLAAMDAGDDTDQMVIFALREYDRDEPYNLEPIASREEVYAAYLRAYGHGVDFGIPGRGENAARSYLWSNMADPGGGECERRRHYLRLRRQMIADGEPDPAIQARIDVENQRAKGITKPIAARSGGHILPTQHNPPPPKVGR